MNLNLIVVVVVVPLTFVFACGSSDSNPFLGAPTGDAGDGGKGAGTGATPSGGTAGAVGQVSQVSGASGGGGLDGLAGGDRGGADGHDVAGQGGISNAEVNGGAVNESGAGGVHDAAGAHFAGAFGDFAGGSGEGGELNEPELLGAHCISCSITALGSPAWRLAGAAMSAGVVGSVDDPDAQAMLDFLSPILAPNHKYNATEYYYGPGDAHVGPYTDEGFAALTAANIAVKQAFNTSDFTAPAGIFLTFNAVPGAGAPLGSSPDFALGPIIPNELFPLVVDGDLYRDGVLYDPYFDTSYSGLDTWQPPLTVAGSSHTMLWFGENSSFVAGVAAQGNYEYRISVVDAEGSGWAITVPFTVSDPPTP